MEYRSRLNIIIFCVVLMGVTLSGLSGWAMYQIEQRAIISDFEKDVDVIGATINREVSTNFEALRTLAVLFHQGKVPTLESFSFEAGEILKRHQHILALEWVPRITDENQARYLSTIKIDFPQFHIVERDRQGVLKAAEARQEYYPIYFVEPFIGNEGVLGLDLASNPAVLAALARTRDKGLPQATESIILSPDTESTSAKVFLAFLPVYQGNPITMSQRRKAIVGFVLGTYRVEDIFNSAYVDDPDDEGKFEIQLIDETSELYKEVLYRQEADVGEMVEYSIQYREELRDVWGRKWVLIASPTKSYLDEHRDILAGTFFVIGILFTFFLVVSLSFVARRNATIKEQVKEQTLELSIANQKLRHLSRSDGLTGLFNRRYMNEFLEAEWLRAIRRKSSMSFILIDIDCFKLYNDHYGHLRGDDCLIDVAQALNSIPARASDIVARYGGEEFAIILGDTADPLPLANYCREVIETLNIPHEFSQVNKVVTISVGVSVCRPQRGSNPHLLIGSADKALYSAKHNGRNRVEIILLEL